MSDGPLNPFLMAALWLIAGVLMLIHTVGVEYGLWSQSGIVWFFALAFLLGLNVAAFYDYYHQHNHD